MGICLEWRAEEETGPGLVQGGHFLGRIRGEREIETIVREAGGAAYAMELVKIVFPLFLAARAPLQLVVVAVVVFVVVLLLLLLLLRITHLI